MHECVRMCLRACVWARGCARVRVSASVWKLCEAVSVRVYVCVRSGARICVSVNVCESGLASSISVCVKVCEPACFSLQRIAAREGVRICGLNHECRAHSSKPWLWCPLISPWALNNRTQGKRKCASNVQQLSLQTCSICIPSVSCVCKCAIGLPRPLARVASMKATHIAGTSASFFDPSFGCVNPPACVWVRAAPCV